MILGFTIKLSGTWPGNHRYKFEYLADESGKVELQEQTEGLAAVELARRSQ